MKENNARAWQKVQKKIGAPNGAKKIIKQSNLNSIFRREAAIFFLEKGNWILKRGTGLNGDFLGELNKRELDSGETDFFPASAPTRVRVEACRFRPPPSCPTTDLQSVDILYV